MIRTSDSTKFLVAALGEFHKAEVSVPKNASNPFFKSKYADLWTIKSQCDPALNEVGLVVTQFPGISEEGGSTLITRLAHSSGEFMEAETPLLLPKDSPQDQGSAITYMRRYALCAILGIVADPDDDGEAAMRTHRKPSEKRTQARSSGPVFVPPTDDDSLADVLRESLAQRPAETADPPTPKQLSYLRALIRDAGMADSDVELMVNQHAPSWPGELSKIDKRQASKLIELLK